MLQVCTVLIDLEQGKERMGMIRSDHHAWSYQHKCKCGAIAPHGSRRAQLPPQHSSAAQHMEIALPFPV